MGLGSIAEWAIGKPRRPRGKWIDDVVLCGKHGRVTGKDILITKNPRYKSGPQKQCRLCSNERCARYQRRRRARLRAEAPLQPG